MSIHRLPVVGRQSFAANEYRQSIADFRYVTKRCRQELAEVLTLRFIAGMFSAAVMTAGAEQAWAQDYPAKVIRVVTSPPGGSNDFAARLIARGLADSAGWQTVVDNRPTLISAEVVSKAAPDGYTLLVAGGTFVIGHLLEKLSYDPVRDFSPVSMTHRQPNILVVHPSLPVKSVKDLIALAKAKPGELDYASSLTGSTNHLAAELFNAMANVRIVRINYKGTGPALNGLLGGEVHLMYLNPAAIAPHMKSGRLKALAVTGGERFPLLPELPTVAASGLPGFESVLITAVYAPAATPAAIVNRLRQEVVRVINLPDVKEKFTNTGVETVGSSPQELAAAMKAEITRMGKVIRDAGIRIE